VKKAGVMTNCPHLFTFSRDFEPLALVSGIK
jgi:hypothetical protein